MRILIDDDISPWYGISADSIDRKLKSASGDITVEISSDGGDVFEGVRIFNLLKNYTKGEITTVIMSQAISISSYIFLAGKNRIVYDNSTYMIHNASKGAWGDYRVMSKNSELLRSVTDIAMREYAKVSGRDSSEIEKELDDETWFFGKEILDKGFATEIRESGKDVSSSKKETILNFKQQKTACDARNSEQCLRNYKKDDNTREDITQILEGLNQIQQKEENMEVKLADVINFISTANSTDKALILQSAGAVDEVALKLKTDEITKLSNQSSTFEQKLKDNGLAFEKAMVSANDSMKTVLKMATDSTYSAMSATDKETVLGTVKLLNDGTFDKASFENALLKATLASSAPQGGQNHRDSGDDYSEYENNQDTGIGGNE